MSVVYYITLFILGVKVMLSSSNPYCLAFYMKSAHTSLESYLNYYPYLSAYYANAYKSFIRYTNTAVYCAFFYYNFYCTDGILRKYVIILSKIGSKFDDFNKS